MQNGVKLRANRRMRGPTVPYLGPGMPELGGRCLLWFLGLPGSLIRIVLGIDPPPEHVVDPYLERA